MYIPDVNRRKLDSKAFKFIRIGYSSNGYKLFDVNRRRVVWSRDVTQSFKEAMSLRSSDAWFKAMNEEITSFKTKGT